MMIDVGAGSEGLIAVGADGQPGDYDAAVWRSVDGLTWDRLPHDDAVLGGTGAQVMHTVLQTAAGVIAAGQSSGNAGVWLSSDGTAWTRAEITEASGTPTPGISVIFGLHEGVSGLVAVGGTGLEWDGWSLSAVSTTRPAVWLSADGQSWSRIPEYVGGSGAGVEGAESVGGALTHVVAVGSGLVALADTAHGPVVWTSDDGFEWRRLDSTFGEEPPATHISIGDVISSDGRLIAVGGYAGDAPGYSGPDVTVTWLSLDRGLTWHVVASQATSAPGWDGIDSTPLGVERPVMTAFGEGFVTITSDWSFATGEEIQGYEQYARAIAAWRLALLDG